MMLEYPAELSWKEKVAGAAGMIVIFGGPALIVGYGGIASAFGAAVVVLIVAARLPADSYPRLIAYFVAFVFVIAASHAVGGYYGLVAFIAGTAIGSFVAILFADRSGASDLSDFPFLIFAFAGTTSYFAILLIFAALLPQGWLAWLEEWSAPLLLGLLGLALLLLLGRSVYYSILDRYNSKRRPRNSECRPLRPHGVTDAEWDALKKEARASAQPMDTFLRGIEVLRQRHRR